MNYSTDAEINAAVAEKVLEIPGFTGINYLTWHGVGMIVEKMREKKLGDFDLQLRNGYAWVATFYRPSEEFEGRDCQAPRAVALAALAALEESHGKA